MIAGILEWQQGPGNLKLTLDDREGRLHSGAKRLWAGQVSRITALTTVDARALADALPDALLIVESAAPSALRILQDSGISYVTRAGEWFIYRPPSLIVVKPADRRVVLESSAGRPLGKAASRIARWLLLNPETTERMVGELAEAVGVSDGAASRAIRHLEDRDLVETNESRADTRRKLVQATAPGALLDALADDSHWRRPRRVVWDIGARSASEALELVRKAGHGLTIPYSVGELAGAAMLERLVEPSAVVLWLPRDGLDAWAAELLAEPGRPSPGAIVARPAPDPFVFEWSTSRDGIQVADEVQLYLDCRTAGERALDAAEMLRRRLVSR